MGWSNEIEDLAYAPRHNPLLPGPEEPGVDPYAPVATGDKDRRVTLE
jgi:hypothetical protein